MDLFKSLLEKRLNGIEEEIKDLKKSRDNLAGVASQKSVYVAYVISAISIGMAIFGLVM